MSPSIAMKVVRVYSATETDSKKEAQVAHTGLRSSQYTPFLYRVSYIYIYLQIVCIIFSLSNGSDPSLLQPCRKYNVYSNVRANITRRLIR